MKNTVIYHRADFDGLFCREIARKFLPDADLIGWHYGDRKVSFPIEGTIYILDLSPECLGGDTYDSSRIIWIDHHKSAIEQFPATIPGYRIDGVSACRLAWQWFALNAATPNPEESALPDKQHFFDRQVQEPLAVRLAGEYDIFDKRDPNADLFQHGLRSQNLDGMWPLLLSEGELSNKAIVHLLNAGQSIQYFQNEQNKDIITSYGFDIEFEGLKFLACNHARFNPQLFTAGLKPEHDACFGFKWTGKLWEISLYHVPGKEHHDLSLIAKKYGGGGHRGACGFRLSSVQIHEMGII